MLNSPIATPPVRFRRELFPFAAEHRPLFSSSTVPTKRLRSSPMVHRLRILVFCRHSRTGSLEHDRAAFDESIPRFALDHNTACSRYGRDVIDPRFPENVAEREDQSRDSGCVRFCHLSEPIIKKSCSPKTWT